MSDEQVMELLRQGRKLEAIKLYREQTGMGLREALEAVEAMAVGDRPPAPPPPDLAADVELAALLQQGRKIDAIRVYRERTGVGLKEAKDAVEAMAAGQAPTVLPTLDTDTQLQLLVLLEQGRKPEAMRLFRERTGWGRAQAARAVAQIAAEHGLARPAGSGCLTLVVISLLLSLAPMLLR